jgi:hypothetical protein
VKTENAMARALGCEALPLIMRRLPTQTLLALELIGRLDTAPRLLRGRDARGKAFARLLYRQSKGVWQGLYLGGIEANDEALLRERVTGLWPVTGGELNRTIRTLLARRVLARQKAHALASRCGYGFRGWMLHKQPRRTT